MTAKKIVLNVVLPIVALLGAFMTIGAFMRSRPETPKMPPEVTGQVVRVTLAEEASQRAKVTAVGRVRAARELTVMPEVSGRLTEIHAALQPGGLIREGEELLRIDDRAYRLMVSQQEANAAAARVDLQVESGRRSVAEREWALLESDVQATAEGKALALRKPYERLAQVRVASARAALERARLDVERTVIKAPFNALVREETAELGMLVGPQSAIARLVGTDAFWVEVSLPFDDLARIRVPRPGESDATGAAATVLPAHLAGEASPETYTGRAIRLLGDLDAVGAQARVLIEVPDPLGLQSGKTPLLLNTFVEVHLETEAAPDAIRVPRVALREGDVVWVLKADDTLEFRDVEVGARERDFVLVRSGLAAGERIITSRLAAPVPGMKLKVADEAVKAASAPAAPAGTSADGAPPAAKAEAEVAR